MMTKMKYAMAIVAALVLIVFAAHELEQHTTAQAQRKVIEDFYAHVIASDVRGVPSQETIEKFMPLISSQLRDGLAQLKLDQDIHLQETKGESPPLWEDPLFVGAWEGAQKVLDIQRDSDSTRVSYDVTLQSPPPYDKDASGQWKDRVILVQEHGKWVVDDVVYHPKSDTAGALSLLGVFKITSGDCSDALSQKSMNDCAHRNYKREEQLLEKSTQQILTQIDASRQRSFKAVQQTWVQFRKQQCSFDASRYDGGSMAPMVYFTCMAELTQQRNKELNVILSDEH